MLIQKEFFKIAFGLLLIPSLFIDVVNASRKRGYTHDNILTMMMHPQESARGLLDKYFKNPHNSAYWNRWRDQQTGDTLLHYAIRQKNLKARIFWVGILSDFFPDLCNVLNNKRRTPFAALVYAGVPESHFDLFDKIATDHNLYATDISGKTPYSIALVCNKKLARVFFNRYATSKITIAFLEKKNSELEKCPPLVILQSLFTKKSSMLEAVAKAFTPDHAAYLALRFSNERLEELLADRCCSMPRIDKTVLAEQFMSLKDKNVSYKCWLDLVKSTYCDDIARLSVKN